MFVCIMKVNVLFIRVCLGWVNKKYVNLWNYRINWFGSFKDCSTVGKFFEKGLKKVPEGLKMSANWSIESQCPQKRFCFQGFLNFPKIPTTIILVPKIPTKIIGMHSTVVEVLKVMNCARKKNYRILW